MWKFQIIKKNCRTKKDNENFFLEFHDCFGEIGTLKTTHHTEVKDNVKPLVTPVGKVPHLMHLIQNWKKDSNEWLI